MIKFYRGLRHLYNINLHGDGIYFTTDTFEIIHNGESYRTKVYRVETLPEIGEVGSIYLVYGGLHPMMYLCVEETIFEPYTIKDYIEIENTEMVTPVKVEEETIVIDSKDMVSVSYNTLRTHSVFADVEDETLIFK